MTSDPASPVPPFAVSDVSLALQRFVDRGSQSFEAEADNLVRVRVGPSLNVLRVEILHLEVPKDWKTALEAAIASAANLALQKAAIAAGEALAELEQKVDWGAAAAKLEG
jgi:hypothetical protein